MRHAKFAIAVSGALAMFLATGDIASAGRGSFRLMNQDGGGNGNVDIAVRQVTVAPVRAHVGDVVRVEVVIENKAEGYATVSAEVFVWEDSSKSDNSLDVKHPLLLAAPGAPFPGGKKPGGSATEKDPRFGNSSPGGSEPAGGTGAAGGY